MWSALDDRGVPPRLARMSAELAGLGSYDPLGLRSGAGARRYLLLDVFTDRPFEGNPLAVFMDAEGLGGAQMQAIAAELKLSETVFVLPAQAGGDARVRIFTPASEMPFAGHPVLGTAIALAGALGAGRVTLETGAGIVPVVVEASGPRSGEGRMEQPLPTRRPFEREPELLLALGLERSELPVLEYVNGPRHVLVAAGSRAQLAALEPDMAALTRLGEIGVSCFSGDGGWRTRMFAPALGVPEDPATGSAAGPLAVHLALHGLIGFGEEVELLQGVEIGRPSRLRARVEGDAQQLRRVEVAGDAVVVAEGALVPPAAAA
jgi:trans-2,3-dihydro-3-hydroxyanthranilate isomerase